MHVCKNLKVEQILNWFIRMNGQFKRNQRKDKNNVFITKKDKPDFLVLFYLIRYKCFLVMLMIDLYYIIQGSFQNSLAKSSWQSVTCSWTRDHVISFRHFLISSSWASIPVIVHHSSKHSKCWSYTELSDLVYLRVEWKVEPPIVLLSILLEGQRKEEREKKE